MRPNSGTKVLAKMQDPICIECKCTESLLWRQVEDGDGQLCLECHKQRSVIASEDQDTTDTSVGRTNGVRSNASDSRNKFTPGTRKSTRTTRSKVRRTTSNLITKNHLLLMDKIIINRLWRKQLQWAPLQFHPTVTIIQ